VDPFRAADTRCQVWLILRLVASRSGALTSEPPASATVVCEAGESAGVGVGCVLHRVLAGSRRRKNALISRKGIEPGSGKESVWDYCASVAA